MWELIAINQRRSIYLFLVMGVILILLGYFIGAYLIEDGGVCGIVIALLIWLALSAVSYYSSDSLFINLSGAYEVPRELHPQLHNVVEEMVIAAQLKVKPRIYIIDDPNLNAFATGITPEKSAVAVTSGLLAQLNRDELQGVIAHEISHIYNRDTQFLTFASMMLGSIQLISEGFLRGLRFSGGSRRSRSSKSSGVPVLLIIALIFAILGPILARILYFAISRKREYLADASAVRLTRYPAGLASALEKISKHSQIASANKVSAPMYIVNPLADTSLNLWNTHPPITERIKILRSLHHGVDFRSYQYAYQRVLRSRQQIIPKVALNRYESISVRESTVPDVASEDIKNENVPVSENTGSDLISEVIAEKEVTDLLRAVSNFIFLNCSCGIRYKIPPEYKNSSIWCPRCGEIKTIPGAGKTETSKPVATGGQVYQRTGKGWESIECACGRIIQLSPICTADSIQCPECGDDIKIVSKSDN